VAAAAAGALAVAVVVFLPTHKFYLHTFFFGLNTKTRSICLHINHKITAAAVAAALAVAVVVFLCIGVSLCVHVCLIGEYA